MKMDEILAFTKQHLTETHEAMLKQVNQHQKNVEYEVKDMVFLSSKNIKTQRPSKKLNDKMLKPFKIVKKVGRAFQLELLRTMLIHDVFHSSLL